MCSSDLLVWVYGVLPSAGLLVGFALVEGMISSISSPASQSLMAKVAPHGRASAAQGLQASGDLVAAVGMSFIAPWMYGAKGPAFTFAFAAVLMVIMGVAVALMLRTTATPQD